MIRHIVFLFLAFALATISHSQVNRGGDTTSVIVNGQILDDLQIAEITETYGVAPLPGSYWYDFQSGLYGVDGYQAFGFMFPGHIFPDMDPQCSAGDTEVYVNGRHLPQGEWLVWSQILGYWIMPGRYWLDAYGNAGYEGNPIPTTNLYTATQQNGAGGGGGDNFWTSRFSAGNSNAGNTQGYVSVPGHGPVGYGF